MSNNDNQSLALRVSVAHGLREGGGSIAGAYLSAVLQVAIVHFCWAAACTHMWPSLEESSIIKNCGDSVVGAFASGMLSVIFGNYITGRSVTPTQVFISPVNNVGRIILFCICLILLVSGVQLALTLILLFPLLLIVFIAALLFMVYIVAVEWAFVIPAIILENKSLKAAIKRSRRLTYGCEEKLFFVWVFQTIVNICLVVLYSVDVKGASTQTNSGHHIEFLTYFSTYPNYTSALTVSLTQPIFMGLVTKWYFQARVQYELSQLSSLRAELTQISSTIDKVDNI